MEIFSVAVSPGVVNRAVARDGVAGGWPHWRVPVPPRGTWQ